MILHHIRLCHKLDSILFPKTLILSLYPFFNIVSNFVFCCCLQPFKKCVGLFILDVLIFEFMFGGRERMNDLQCY